MRMFDAMVLKQELLRNYQLEVQILETSRDGVVLRFTDNLISREFLDIISEFVEKHNLNVLFDDGIYFISEQILEPYEPMYSE